MAEKRLLTAKEIEQASALAGYGLSVEQIAAVFDMSKATFERRQQDQPALAEGLLKGRAAAAAQVTQTAFQMANSGKVPVMTIFWLKCRMGWKEPVTDRTEDPRPFTLAYPRKADEKPKGKK